MNTTILCTKKRLFELDIAKGLAISFMIFDHVLEEFASTQLEDSFLAEIIYFLATIPAAPVFMFLMGVGFAFSRYGNDHPYYFKRGLVIFGVAYLLNIMRGTLPYVMEYICWGEFDLSTLIESTFEIDILQFAGLTMICWGIIIRLKLNNNVFALVSLLVLMGILNLVLLDIKTENVTLTCISGLFWGSSELSFFPFLSWIFYPIAGVIFAISIKNQVCFAHFYSRQLFLIGLFFAAANIIYYKMDIEYLSLDDIEYYHHNILHNIMYIFMIIIWISLLYFAAKVLPTFIKNIFQRWSKNIAFIYLIHLILVAWIDLLLPDGGISLIAYIIGSISIFILSDFLAWILSKRGFKLF